MLYIKKKDYNYLEGLCNGLDGVKREGFLGILLKEASEKIDKKIQDISKITVLDDIPNDGMEIENKEIITKTMIKKAYKSIKV